MGYIPGKLKKSKTRKLTVCSTIKWPVWTAGGFYTQLQQQQQQQQQQDFLTNTIRLLIFVSSRVVKLVPSSLVALGTGLVRRLVGSRASTRHETHETCLSGR